MDMNVNMNMNMNTSLSMIVSMNTYMDILDVVGGFFFVVPGGKEPLTAAFPSSYPSSGRGHVYTCMPPPPVLHHYSILRDLRTVKLSGALETLAFDSRRLVHI